MTHLHKLIFIAILSIYLTAGLLYATLTPPWQAPDEPAHYNYIQYLVTQRSFPELTAGCYDQDYLNRLTTLRFPPELSIQPVCYEFHQPPLYYLLLTPVYGLNNGALPSLRLVSVLMGAGVVLLAFGIATTIFPNKAVITLGTMAFVAFVPMHVAILSSVNNDALAELMLALLLLLITRRIMVTPKAGFKADLMLGLGLGLGLITKTTVYIALPVAAVALWLAETPTRWGNIARRLPVVYGLALLIALPWYVRNAAMYGPFDILGLGRHDEVVVGQLRTAEALAQVGGAALLGDFVTTTFRSFWGQFGWMAVPMDNRTYLFLALLSAVAAAGLMALWVTAPSPGASIPLTALQKRALMLMALAIGLMLLAYTGYNLTFKQFQGRYLFPGLIPLGLFFSLGLYEALQPKWTWWLVGGLGLALVGVAIISNLNGGIDKRAIFGIMGVAVLIAVQKFLPSHRLSLVVWLLIISFAGLSLLTLLTPFWFIVPYL
jgi:4-amino-4-deoxy-L-arabinose transferase-like glycosyltransferase